MVQIEVQLDFNVDNFLATFLFQLLGMYGYRC
jgi:hypothetical protein